MDKMKTIELTSIKLVVPERMLDSVAMTMLTEGFLDQVQNRFGEHVPATIEVHNGKTMVINAIC